MLFTTMCLPLYWWHAFSVIFRAKQGPWPEEMGPPASHWWLSHLQHRFWPTEEYHHVWRLWVHLKGVWAPLEYLSIPLRQVLGAIHTQAFFLLSSSFSVEMLDESDWLPVTLQTEVMNDADKTVSSNFFRVCVVKNSSFSSAPAATSCKDLSTCSRCL